MIEKSLNNLSRERKEFVLHSKTTKDRRKDKEKKGSLAMPVE